MIIYLMELNWSDFFFFLTSVGTFSVQFQKLIKITLFYYDLALLHRFDVIFF